MTTMMTIMATATRAPTTATAIIHPATAGAGPAVTPGVVPPATVVAPPVGAVTVVVNCRTTEKIALQCGKREHLVYVRLSILHWDSGIARQLWAWNQVGAWI